MSGEQKASPRATILTIKAVMHDRCKQSLACLVLVLGAAIPAWTQSSLVSSRVVEPVNDSRLVKLTGNTVPMARPQFDQGRMDSGKMLEKVLMVLKRSPEQEAALAAFNERQYDPKSRDFHHWLHAEEFGQLYGPSDSDIAQVTSWLQNRGFQITEVSKGRVWFLFSGSVSQVEQAFHVEMHNYLVNGKTHISNDRDPSIPAALAPVIAGIASLQDFFPEPQLVRGKWVKRNKKTGKVTLMNPQPGRARILAEELPVVNGGGKNPSPPDHASPFQIANPQFGFIDQDDDIREDMTPWDFATIYNVLPLWQAAKPINGTGITVAIAATSDVEATDISTFRREFDLSATTINTIETDPATDPGVVSDGGNLENTLDLEMVSAAAPGASLDLVVSANTSTTFGNQLSANYIIDNETAPIMNSSYGLCELQLGTAGNAAVNQVWQQGATEGISIFVSAGDQGSAGCTDQNTPAPNLTPYGFQVNGLASSPFVTAVGGTDSIWWYQLESAAGTLISTYWNLTNAANQGNAKGYIPEIAWNSTCANPLLLTDFINTTTGEPFPNTEALCQAADGSADFLGLMLIAGGSGGVSACTTNSTPGITSSTLAPSSCSAGYSKPSWQTALTPADGHRDLPDISMFASAGYGVSGMDITSSAVLICATDPSQGIDSCDYSGDEIVDQEVGGTSAASPYSAGVMAMVLQKNGGAKQGLANPVFYKMAAAQSTAACNSSTEAAGNACFFNDITQGSNAMACTPGDPACTVINSGNTVGVLNVNGVTQYNAAAGYDLATGLGSMNVANLVNGWVANGATVNVTPAPTTLTFALTGVGSTSAAQAVTITNTGTASAALTSETLTGADASSFAIATNTCGAALYPGTSCTVSVELKPAARGTLTASLSIADSAAGTPQTVALSGTGDSAGAASTTALQFVAVTPCRVADTRNATGPFGGPELTGGTTRAFDIPQGACSIPSSAVAYSLNVTVVPGGPLGYLSMWASGQPQPLVSTLNSDGRVKANAAIVPAGTNGGVSVFVTDSTQVILDIDGYFAPAGTASALAFYPVTPCRAVDTRNAAGALGGPSLAAGASRNFPLPSSNCNLPATAVAYSLNVTSVPQGPLNYLSLWPSGQSQPLVSTLNAPTGTVTANAAIVPAGSGGAVSVYVTNASDIVLDVDGYFAAPGAGGLSVYTTTPCRVLDTRISSGVFSGTLEVSVASSACAPPSTAQAYVLNATVVPPAPMGYLSLWPQGENQPLVSTLNALDGAVTSNMAIVPANDGNIDAYSSSANQLILDLSAYFAP